MCHSWIMGVAGSEGKFFPYARIVQQDDVVKMCIFSCMRWHCTIRAKSFWNHS